MKTDHMKADRMKTQGEIEALACSAMTRFEQEHMGRGPKSVSAHLLDDVLLIRLHGVLTAAEQNLVKAMPADRGRDLVKQVRSHLMETARPILETVIQQASGANVVSLHHDISTVTGEEIVVLTLDVSPAVRPVRRG